MVIETDLVPPSTSLKLTGEIGRTGLRRFGGYLSEEFDPNLRGQKGARKFDEMRRNDPDAGAILLAIEMSILSVDWSVERQGDTPQDEEAADFLEQCKDDMSMSWGDLISDICTMFPFGFHLAETVYKYRNGPKPKSTAPNAPAPSKYNDGRIGWRKIAPRHQETIYRWAYDENGGLRGAWQELPQGGVVFLPIDKCLLFTTRRERGNPEGYSILRNAWHSYYIKTNSEEIEVISAERDMSGIPRIRLPVGADQDDKDAALEILEKIKWDDQAGLVLPRMGEGEHTWWDFDTVQSSGTPRVNLEEVIQRSTIAIARSVLAQFLTLGSGAVGSYSLSSDMRDLFHLAIKGWLSRIEETINRFAVDRLFALNDFQNLTDTPKLRAGRMGQRQVDVFVAAIEKLFTLGMPITREDWDFIREELEMPKLPEDEELEDLNNNNSPAEDVAPTQEPDEDDNPDNSQTTSEKWFSRDF